MELPDVNVLVAAFRSDAPDHELCRAWLDGLVNGDAAYAMSDHVLSGFLRIVTHSRVFKTPAPLSEALAFARGVREPAHCVRIVPGSGHWGIFESLCREGGVRGNLVPDAFFAALAIEAGCEWVTLDRDYSRFAPLTWRLPG